MTQLHLARLLTATGVAAAFLAIPPHILGSNSDSVAAPLSRQVHAHNVGQHAHYDKHTPRKSAAGRRRSGLPMPHLLVLSEEIGGGAARQSYKNLLVSLVEQAKDSSRSTALPAPVLAMTSKPGAPKTRVTKQPIVGSASRIVVPSIGIDIGVQTGVYDPATGSWEVDDGSAFYADTTVPVNDTNGTTLIYGHARWGIFGTLPDVQPGAEVTVYTAEGMRFVYAFETLKQVDPSDTSMLTSRGKPKLLLQTCSGLFDQHRTLALFALKEVHRG